MPYRATEQTEARRAAVRERVVDAARELIARGGYQEARVAAVAARAGVATGTVYRHFPSKADLFAEVFRSVSQREVDAARAAASALEADAPASARLRAAIEAFCRRALRARRQAWALLAEPVDPAVEAERLVFRRAHAAHFAEILRDGIAAGELRTRDPDLAAAALVGALGEALVGPLSPVAPTKKANADTVVADLVAFCLAAVNNHPEPAHVDARP
jgi:AcrR family transcriptional regulator